MCGVAIGKVSHLICAPILEIIGFHVIIAMITTPTFKSSMGLFVLGGGGGGLRTTLSVRVGVHLNENSGGSVISDWRDTSL